MGQKQIERFLCLPLSGVATVGIWVYVHILVYAHVEAIYMPLPNHRGEKTENRSAL